MTRPGTKSTGMTAVLSAAAVLCAAALPPRSAAAETEPARSFYEQPPAELEGIDIEEHLDAPLPLDLAFTDDAGREVRLGDYFNRGRPVILTLGYYRCPQLCFLVLNGLVDALKEIDYSPGREFEIVTISINPEEEHPLARLKKDSYMAFYQHPRAAEHWHFLTGPAAHSRAVAEAVGFKYRQTAPGDFAHAAVLTLCTPDGRVSRYLYGAMFEPRTLKLGLLEAGEGKIGTTLERFILWCHVYDPSRNSYAANAMNLMRLGGAATVAVMIGGLTFLWRRDAIHKRGACP
jgi:protein SCO1/2